MDTYPLSRLNGFYFFSNWVKKLYLGLSIWEKIIHFTAPYMTRKFGKGEVDRIIITNLNPPHIIIAVLNILIFGTATSHSLHWLICQNNVCIVECNKVFLFLFVIHLLNYESRLITYYKGKELKKLCTLAPSQQNGFRLS